MRHVLFGFGAAASGVWLVSRICRRQALSPARLPIGSRMTVLPSAVVEPSAGELSADVEHMSAPVSATDDFELILTPPPELTRHRPKQPDTAPAREPENVARRAEARVRGEAGGDIQLPGRTAGARRELPRVDRPDISEPTEFGTSRPCRPGTPLALVAEDDYDIRMLAAHLLERSGFDVVTAADGDEALRLAVERQPAICVLDWMMPKRSGLDVLEALRAGARTASTPVLLLTARAADSDVTRGLEAGADGYLVKPFAADELCSRVQGLLEPLAA